MKNIQDQNRKKCVNFLTLFFAVVIFSFISPVSAYYFADNFEGYTNISNTKPTWSYNGYVDDNTSVVYRDISIDKTGGFNGSSAVKWIYSGSHTLDFEKSLASQNLDHLYAKFRFKVSANPIGGIKFFKIFGVVNNTGPAYANWTWNFGPTTATPSFLSALCYGNGIEIANDTQTCIYPDGQIGGDTLDAVVTNVGNLFYPQPDTWYQIETYNKYSTDNNHDGEVWLKINGIEYLRVTNMVNRNNADSRTISKISFGDYSNSNADITMWIDEVELSDDPINLQIKYTNSNFITLLPDWLKTVSTSDINNDGIVNSGDLGIMMSNWN